MKKVGIIILIIISILLIIAVIKKKDKTEIDEPIEPEETILATEEPKTEQPIPTPTFKSGLHNTATPKPRASAKASAKPVNPVDTINRTLIKYDNNKVPDKLLDGTSCKQFLKDLDTDKIKITISKEYTQSDYILVGAAQNKANKITGDLESVGWLMNNIDSISSDTLIYFTDLHIVGIKNNMVLCMYNFHSIFGMTDCLVALWGINTEDLKAGDTISVGIFRGNMKLTTVNNIRILITRY